MKKLQSRQASLARQTSDLAMAVPVVVAHRVGRMLLAGPQPGARDQKEFIRMGAEKVEAFQESWVSMLARSAALQQQWGLQAMNLWWQWALGGGWMRPRAMQTLMGTQAENALLSSLDVAASGLTPVSRRAVANSRRLSRPRRKRS